MGLIDIKTNERNGPVASAKAVTEDDQPSSCPNEARSCASAPARSRRSAGTRWVWTIMELEGDDQVAKA